MSINHGPECYDDAHCDCLEDFEPGNYILDVIAMWFPGYTETYPQYKIKYTGIDDTSRTFSIETIDGKFIKEIRVSVDVEVLGDNGNEERVNIFSS